MADNNVLMKVNSVSKIYQMGEVTVPAIKSIDLEVYKIGRASCRERV